MRIKYFGNMKDDNGHFREDTRIAVIYFKDSEEEKVNYIFHILKEEGYQLCNIGDDGDGLNEYWFSVEDKEDFDNFKSIYLEHKRCTPEQPENASEPETIESTPEQSEDVSEPEPDNKPDTAETTLARYTEFNRSVCRCCQLCTRLSECDKVMTYDVFSNVTEEIECRCCSGDYTCCSDFTPEHSEYVSEPEPDNKPDTQQECELCSKCVRYSECKEKGTVVKHSDCLCAYVVCPDSVCCPDFLSAGSFSYVVFDDEEHWRLFFKVICRMNLKPHKDPYREALAYLITLDAACRQHIDDLYDFEECVIKPEVLDRGWQTGTSLRTTFLAFNLFTGHLNWCPEELKVCCTPADVFCCSYAPYYWEAIKIRYPDYTLRSDIMPF